MEKAFMAGNASREEIIKDAKTLKLNMDIIQDFFDKDTTSDDDSDDDSDEKLFSVINSKWGDLK